jgi:dihydroflavonol-4-reductase
MILVTGATGFLGSHVVAQLCELGQPLRLLCRRRPNDLPVEGPEVQAIRGDVLDPASLREACRGVCQVFHLAGRVDFNPRNPDELLAVNEQGTRNVLDAARQAGVERVVHVSSVSTIGATVDFRRPLNEDDFGMGLGVELPYPQSKLRGERVALEFAGQGLPIVIVNPTFFLGPDDKNLSSARTVLAFVRRQVWTGLRTGGLGLTDVRDVARGIILAMERGEPGTRYILGGHNFLLHEYHALLARVTGLRAPRIRLPAPLAIPLAFFGSWGYRLLGIQPYVGVGDVRLGRHYWLYDYTRAREKLGLVCRPPEVTVRETLDWLASIGLYSQRRSARNRGAATCKTTPSSVVADFQRN